MLQDVRVHVCICDPVPRAVYHAVWLEFTDQTTISATLGHMANACIHDTEYDIVQNTTCTDVSLQTA